ncbi:MAG TPA: activator of (R)-2-hydroxyglutaryl-CoA dehydratase [Acidobacteriota bacterium]|nr:activator of (R)-2-hydroxyglutaryl-CoA dehydratase [Acidobacteriota bacterium]
MELVRLENRETDIQTRVRLERERLRKELGLDEQEREHFRRPEERPFTADQRAHTTVLFGGLTWKHEHLIHGSLEGLGYKCEYLATPDVQAYRLGKEYGNNGQCNPTYFTVGNLIKHLQDLEEKGLTKQQIVNNYVFFTAGACGPCRFGMYEAEYRLALRNSGFDGFRVLLFQQSGGLSQAGVSSGLEMNLDFFLGILNALNIGDLLNALGHLIRPYEVNEGQTDRVLDDSVRFLHDVMKSKERPKIAERWARLLGSKTGTATDLLKFINQLRSDHYIEGLRQVRKRFEEIEVDYTRVRPIVHITGEFWAQTTEGDGNFHMFRFLEKEGAEVVVEPVGTWILYMLHQAVQKTRDTKNVNFSAPLWRLDLRTRHELGYFRRLMLLKLAESVFKREFNRLRRTLGETVAPLNDQYELQRLGHPYYNSRAGGGEGHLEVAKNIYYSNKDLAHMVLSLKPFGCMPSTQSDGAQAAVTAHYKDMIYLPIETSGEGAVNAYSRVQMALGEARTKASEEFKQALGACGYSLNEVRSFTADHPELRSPFFRIRHRKGVVGKAANYVLQVSELMRKEMKSRISLPTVTGGEVNAGSES